MCSNLHALTADISVHFYWGGLVLANSSLVFIIPTWFASKAQWVVLLMLDTHMPMTTHDCIWLEHVRAWRTCGGLVPRWPLEDGRRRRTLRTGSRFTWLCYSSGRVFIGSNSRWYWPRGLGSSRFYLDSRSKNYRWAATFCFFMCVCA